MNKKSLSISALIFLALGMGAVEVIMNSRGEVVSDSTQSLWGILFVIVTIVWAMADSETNEFDKPFDFGFLMYIFWPIALPYYLISTRGIEGIVLFFGFISIWLGPWLAGLVAYTYVYTS
ncbi:MAG: hypothetical protein V7721_01000 [Porticoccaceae bacterium]